VSYDPLTHSRHNGEVYAVYVGREIKIVVNVYVFEYCTVGDRVRTWGYLDGKAVWSGWMNAFPFFITVCCSVKQVSQGSHASWKVMEKSLDSTNSHGIF